MVHLKFTLEIDEQSERTEDYQEFIQKLRLRLGVRTIRGRPVLEAQQNTRMRFFDVVIETSQSSVRFRLRRDNLYLVGFQTTGGQWLEFTNSENRHLITNSEFLGFDCNYMGLQRVAGNQRMEKTINIGLRELETAVNQLAQTTKEKVKDNAKHLIIAIMMICESARFYAISEEIGHNNSFRIPAWIKDLAREWSTLCTVMLENDLDRLPPNLRLRNNRVITSIDNIEAVIALANDFNPNSFGSTRAPCFLGIPLLEVYSVQINKMSGVEASSSGNLFGTITVDNGLNTESIFDRTRSKPESTSPSQYIWLTGPSKPVSAIGNVTIKLLLKDKHILHDNEIIDDDISWDAANYIGDLYDCRIPKTLHSSKGSELTVNYAVLKNAVTATVIVTLEEGGERKTEVYGLINAYYGKRKDLGTCKLFDRDRYDYASVKRQHDIPLLRSVVAVPLDDSLRVEANLYNYNTFTANSKIVKGSVEFPVPEPIRGASSTLAISGENGNSIHVTVQWSSSY